MINEYLAMREVARLSGLEYFGALNDSAANELVTAMKTAPDTITAVAVVSEWLYANQKRPTPADLYRAFERLASARQDASKPAFVEDGISFERWKSLGYKPTWEAFLAWAESGANGLSLL